MDLNELWAKTTRLLQDRLNLTVYHTFIQDNLTPASLEGDTVLLINSIDNLQKLIEMRYTQTISEALSEAAGHPMHVKIYSRKDYENRSQPRSATEASDDSGSSILLNPKYRFENFVVGSNNRFAHAAALAVAEAPAEAYNPLFIYGGSGLGKTHLVHAIGHYVLEQHRGKKLLYITSENFTNELISAIQQNKTVEFRKRIRNVDILMVDDIQFIAGRESTQEEFFHTFNELHTAGKQIILTSDRPPQEIARLEERLSSRFAWGLTADIKKPDLDTRIAILRYKAHQENENVPDEVLQLIAENVDSNIRELEGSLTNLVSYAHLVRQEITLDLCHEALRDILEKRKSHAVTDRIIIQTVADYYGIDVDDLIGPSRRRDLAVPRQIAMYLTREMTTMSLPKIGMAFGNRDHTTVIHSCATVSDNIRNNSSMANVVQDLRTMIQEGK